MRWFAVMTKVRKEAYATDNLRAQGYNVFFPHYKEWTRETKHGRSRQVVRALLPRYVFVCIAPGQSLYTVNNTYGVSNVVAYGDGPVEIPESVMSKFKDRADKSGLVEVEDNKNARFAGKPGDQIEFTSENSFSKLVGLIKTIDSDGTIVVELERMLGAVREVEISPDKVAELIRKKKPPQPKSKAKGPTAAQNDLSRSAVAVSDD